MTAKTDPAWYLYAGLIFTTFNLSHLVAWRFGTYVHVGIYALLLLGAVVIAAEKHRLNALLIVTTVTVFILLVLQHPVTEWDARSIWFYHAKRIFYAQDLYAQLDNYPSWNHNDYPALVPAIAASVAKTVEHWNEILPRTSVVIACTPAFFIAAYTFRSAAFFSLWIAALLWSINGYMLTGYMDSLISMYFAIGCILSVKSYKLICQPESAQQRIEMRNLWLGIGICLIHLLLLKNEGTALSALILAVLAPVLLKNLRLIWIPGSVIVFYVVMWRYPVIQAHITNDLVSHEGLLGRGMARIQSPKEFLLIFDALRYHTNFFHKAYFAMTIVTLLNWRRFKCIAPAALAIGLYMGIIFAVYLTTYQELEWHLATSADRVVLPFNFAVVSLLLYMVHLIWTEWATPVESHIPGRSLLAGDR